MKKLIIIFLISILSSINAKSEIQRKEYPLIIAHYMSWYQTPGVSGSWGHWQINRSNISKRFWEFPEIRNYKGWRNISSVYYPVIGVYDSGDPDLCEYHILQAWLAGIDGFVCDWYGPEHGYENTGFKVMRDKSEELGFFKVAICFEDQAVFPGYSKEVKTRSQAVELGKKMMRYLEKEWFNSSAYLKMDGRPVLTDYAWGSPGDTIKDIWLNADEWQQVLSVVTAGRPVFIHDWHAHYWSEDAFEKYDSILPWGDNYHGNTTEIPGYWGKAKKLLGQGNFSFLSGTVLPGFDNRGCGGWGTGSAIGITRRYNGDKLKKTWDDVVKNDVKFIQIATWNDLNEGGTIEPVRKGVLNKKFPADGYGYRELETVQEYARKLKGIKFDKKSLRIPAWIYSCRKIVEKMNISSEEKKSKNKVIDGIREILINGKTGVAEKRIKEIYYSLPELLRNNPDLAVYIESDEHVKNHWGLFDKWGIQACDPALGPLYQTYFCEKKLHPADGRKDILLVRPMSKDVAVNLTRTVVVPEEGAKLLFSVSANDAYADGGFNLTVWINGKEYINEIIKSRSGWADKVVDISEYKGMITAINISVRVNKTIPWDKSHCFITDILVSNIDESVKDEIVKLGSWAENWDIINNSKTIKPEYQFVKEKYYPFPGRKDILSIYPESNKKPVRLKRKIWVPSGGAVLKVSVSPNAVAIGSFKFKILINNENHINSLISSEQQEWKDFEVDLKKFADRPVSIEMIAEYPGSGKGDRHCFLSDVFIEGISPGKKNTKLRDWALDWEIIDCMPGNPPRFMTNFNWEMDYPPPGKNNVLVVHPLSKERPCILKRRVTVPRTGAKLYVSAASDAAQQNIADFVFRIRVNGKMLFYDLISAGDNKTSKGWRNIVVDLSSYSGRDVDIELEASAGGKELWAWEFCYLAEIVVRVTLLTQQK